MVTVTVYVHHDDHLEFDATLIVEDDFKSSGQVKTDDSHLQ